MKRPGPERSRPGTGAPGRKAALHRLPEPVGQSGHGDCR